MKCNATKSHRLFRRGAAPTKICIHFITNNMTQNGIQRFFPEVIGHGVDRFNGPKLLL